MLKTVLDEYNSPSIQFNESVDPGAPTPAPATLERDVSVNDDDVEIVQLLMSLPDQDEREKAGTVGVKQQPDIDDRIVHCFNPPWGNWGGTYKGPASAVADSAQGHYRVHWDGGDKRTIVKLPSGNRRGDITLLNPGEWLLKWTKEHGLPAVTPMGVFNTLCLDDTMDEWLTDARSN